MKETQSTYKTAGVDIDSNMAALHAVGKMVKSTATPGWLKDIGSFSGIF